MRTGLAFRSPLPVALASAALALSVTSGCAGDDRQEDSVTSGETFGFAVDHEGGSDQFAGGFDPQSAPNGGFGGGDCIADKTPVIFVHGNGDEAKNWDFPAATGVPSVYESFAEAGYGSCELFGINWLSESERKAPQFNYHRPEKAEMLRSFIAEVLDYTGQEQVDIVAHSLGVTVALHAIETDEAAPLVRRFIGIAGGLRGLTACFSVGYANALAPTCGSENVFDSDIFGFYPDGYWVNNSRMGDGGFRDQPESSSTLFYTLRAGKRDQILCSGTGFVAGCEDSALFDSHPGVRSQLDVGHGSTAASLDFDLSDWSVFNLGGGDSDGVGHFRSKNNTGQIQVNMLTGDCTGTDCCAGYDEICE